jgi:hypothetical protein
MLRGGGFVRISHSRVHVIMHDNHLHFRAHMVLPKGLSVKEREEWHFMCSVQGLRSFSRGLGPERRLFIGLTALEEASGKWDRPDQARLAQARELHAMLVDAQGGHCQYSFGELCELLASDKGLPPEVSKIQATR